MRLGFFFKLYAGYFSLVVLAATIVGYSVSDWATKNAVSQIRTSLENTAELLRELAVPVLRGGSDPGFQPRVVALGHTIATRLTVTDKGGNVIADSAKEPRQMDRHHDRPEIQMAGHHSKGLGFAERFSRTIGREMIYVARVVEEGGRRLGFVRAALPFTAIDEHRGSLRRSVLTGGLISVVGALLLGYFVARRVTAPLRSITATARGLAQGSYGQRVQIASHDEIGDLGDAFNGMADQLEERMQTITEERNGLQAILASMVEGVIAVDRREAITQMNRVAAGMLGVAPVACIGQPIWEVTRIPELGEVTRKALANSQDFRAEAHVVGDNSDITLALTASPLRSAAREVVGAVVVIHDVSELRRLESVRRDFVANASHELKTPITAIRGLVETMVDDTEMPTETRDAFLRRIKAQASQLSALVSDLLTLSRLESSAVGDAGSRDWRESIGEVVSGYRLVAEGKGIRLSSELTQESAPVLCDADTLRLISSNLLDNAIKYTPEGGSVTVQLRVEAEHALLMVRDTGIGIAPAERERIFERFYRVDKARSRELGGTGLGLAIVRHAASSAGGEVWVDSRQGAGSTFFVRLPLSAVGTC